MTWRWPDCVDIVEIAAMRLFEVYCRSSTVDCWFRKRAKQRHVTLAPRKADTNCYYLTTKASGKNVNIFRIYSNFYTL
jgi:hypothetical protein